MTRAENDAEYRPSPILVKHQSPFRPVADDRAKSIFFGVNQGESVRYTRYRIALKAAVDD